MNEQDQFKKIAAQKAVESVRSGMIIGLGTGSTARFALEEIAARMKSGELQEIVGIPSSVNTAHIAQELGIPLSSLDQNPVVDLTIDGADEVSPDLNLIKGGGGALLREKILAQVSRVNIIITDISKWVPSLGSRGAVPVEVLPYAARPEGLFLESLGASVELRNNPDGSIFKTDQDNLILDCSFGRIKDPAALARKLDSRAGICEHGLFIGLAHQVIVAGPEGVNIHTKE